MVLRQEGFLRACTILLLFLLVLLLWMNSLPLHGEKEGKKC